MLDTLPVLTFRPSCPILGPVIWTIYLSHTPLVSGRLWNNVTMLLKRGSKRKKNCGVRGFCARGGVVTCVNGASVA